MALRVYLLIHTHPKFVCAAGRSARLRSGHARQQPLLHHQLSQSPKPVRAKGIWHPDTFMSYFKNLNTSEGREPFNAFISKWPFIYSFISPT